VKGHALLVVENVSLARDHRLRKQAISLRDAGYRVTVVCRRDPANRALAGVRVRDYPAPADATSRIGFLWEYAYSWVMAATLAWRTYLADRFDVVQVSGTPDIYLAMAAPFRVLGVPLVLDQRDLSPEIYRSRYGTDRGPALRALLACERWSFRTADHVSCVNGSLRSVALRRGGLMSDSVTVVGNGPSVTRAAATQPTRVHHERELHPTCCWVGLMGPQDRLDLVLRAHAHLVHKRGRSDVRLVLVGDGEERARIEQLAVELGIRPYVHFTGWLPEDEVFELMAGADIGLEPNLEPIVSPVKVMEYMASGLAFVAFDLLESRLLGGDAGEYVPPGDVDAFAEAVERLLADPGRRAAMGAAGRRLVTEHLGWEHQETSYVEVFDRLLGGASRPRRHRHRLVPAART
jgi:asparagine synthase (glutamine-hydrolysing)